MNRRSPTVSFQQYSTNRSYPAYHALARAEQTYSLVVCLACCLALSTSHSLYLVLSLSLYFSLPRSLSLSLSLSVSFSVWDLDGACIPGKAITPFVRWPPSASFHLPSLPLLPLPLARIPRPLPPSHCDIPAARSNPSVLGHRITRF